LKSRWGRCTPRRTLSSEVAPTAIAPSGPSSTTAASVADELGDQADCREVRVVGVESQTRNSSASTASVAPDRLHAPSVSASARSAWIRAAAAVATTSATNSQAAGDSVADSPFGRRPLPVIMPVGSSPGAASAPRRRASSSHRTRASSHEPSALLHR
jgi:hypothetical protein